VKMGISKISRTALTISMAFVFGLVNMSSALAQERTLAELKVEVQTRADHNTYPLAGLSQGEDREALGRLNTLDPNEWTASWSILGEPLYGQGTRRFAVVG